MPFRKIEETPWPEIRRLKCNGPEHYPPGMMVFKPGYYEWECPTCGDITRFTVPVGPTLEYNI